MPSFISVRPTVRFIGRAFAMLAGPSSGMIPWDQKETIHLLISRKALLSHNLTFGA
jgi:hypothetical protein